MSLLRLAKKNRSADPESFERARRELIESAIKTDGKCPTSGAELAIIRKQIKRILSDLEQLGIHSELPEFKKHDQFVTTTKDSIDEFFGEGGKS